MVWFAGPNIFFCNFCAQVAKFDQKISESGPLATQNKFLAKKSAPSIAKMVWFAGPIIFFAIFVPKEQNLNNFCAQGAKFDQKSQNLVPWAPKINFWKKNAPSIAKMVWFARPIIFFSFLCSRSKIWTIFGPKGQNLTKNLRIWFLGHPKWQIRAPRLQKQAPVPRILPPKFLKCQIQPKAPKKEENPRGTLETWVAQGLGPGGIGKSAVRQPVFLQVTGLLIFFQSHPDPSPWGTWVCKVPLRCSPT